jgi:hypothetical protein
MATLTIVIEFPPPANFHTRSIFATCQLKNRLGDKLGPKFYHATEYNDVSAKQECQFRDDALSNVLGNAESPNFAAVVCVKFYQSNIFKIGQKELTSRYFPLTTNHFEKKDSSHCLLLFAKADAKNRQGKCKCYVDIRWTGSSSSTVKPKILPQSLPSDQSEPASRSKNDIDAFDEEQRRLSLMNNVGELRGWSDDFTAAQRINVRVAALECRLSSDCCDTAETTTVSSSGELRLSLKQEMLSLVSSLTQATKVKLVSLCGSFELTTANDSRAKRRREDSVEGIEVNADDNEDNEDYIIPQIVMLFFVIILLAGLIGSAGIHDYDLVEWAQRLMVGANRLK